MTWSIDGRKTRRVWLKDLLVTDILIGDRSLTLFFTYCHQIFTKIAIWMLAGGRITKTKKTDKTSKLRHKLSSDVTSHRVTLQILYLLNLVEWNFGYMFRTTARIIWCMVILVNKFYNICHVNSTCTGRLIPV